MFIPLTPAFLYYPLSFSPIRVIPYSVDWFNCRRRCMRLFVHWRNNETTLDVFQESAERQRECRGGKNRIFFFHGLAKLQNVWIKLSSLIIWKLPLNHSCELRTRRLLTLILPRKEGSEGSIIWDYRKTSSNPTLRCQKSNIVAFVCCPNSNFEKSFINFLH